MTENNFSWPEYCPNNPSHELIIAYLTIDIQKSLHWINELHQKIKEIKSGQISSWERTGNAYCLYLFPDHVVIEDDYSEESGATMEISLSDFEQAVVSWKQFVMY